MLPSGWIAFHIFTLCGSVNGSRPMDESTRLHSPSSAGVLPRGAEGVPSAPVMLSVRDLVTGAEVIERSIHRKDGSVILAMLTG
jgi:hypothetical protein